MQQVGVMNLLWCMIACRAHVNLGDIFVAKIVNFFAILWPEFCQFFAFLHFCSKQPGCRPDDASRPNSDPGHCQTFSPLNQLLSHPIIYDTLSMTTSPSWRYRCLHWLCYCSVICFLSINVPDFGSQWLPVITPFSSEDEDEALLLSVQRLD